MFLLMVVVSKKLDESVNQQVEFSQTSSRGQVQKIDFGEITIYRQQEQWMTLPKKSVSNEVAHSIGQHWQQLLSESGKPIELPESIGQTVLFYFGGSSKPVICKVSKRDKILVIQFIESNLEFQIDAQLKHLYLPQ